MKHIVELQYTNPSHEHVSLRRRVETVNRVVEAQSEEEALNRAANQQRALGFRIQSANIIEQKVEESKTEVLSEDVELDEGKVAKALAVGAMSLASMGAKAHTDTTKSVAQLAQERPALAQRLHDIGASGQVPASDKRAAELQRKQDQEMPASERRAKELKKEEVEQVDEGSKRMSAAVKLQRAFEREKTSSDTSRERGKEILAQARAEYAKKQAAKTNEEVEQVDEISTPTMSSYVKKVGAENKFTKKRVDGLNLALNKIKSNSIKKKEVEQMDEVDYKKYLKVSQEKRPLKLSAVDAVLSAEKEGNPNPARKLRNSRDARKFANAQLAKKAAKARPAQKFPVYEPGRKYVGDSVELDGPVIDEANSRNSATAMQQALTPKASDVKAATGTTARDKATTNKYARRISKLTGGDYSKQDVKNNLKSLKAEDAKMKYIEEKLTAADPASKYIKDFVASENPKFAEKSKKERISMALGAYYAAKGKKNEEIVLEEPKDAADVGEYDYEGDMAKSQLRSIMANSKRMYDMLEDTTNLPEWVQSKITLAEDYIVTASNYMESDMNEEVEQVTEAEGTVAVTPKEKSLAAHHGDKTKITFGDVIKARLKSAAAKKMGK